MEADDVTEEGFYYDPESDEVVKVYLSKQMYQKNNGDWVWSEEEILFCQSAWLRCDWPKELIGPIIIPNK